MPVYHPLNYPAYSNKVIDPDLIEHELNRIARAHNTHSTTDFAASAVLNSIMIAPFTNFVVPIGIRGSWSLGAVTVADRLAGVIWPTNCYVAGGYITAEKAENSAGGATITVNLYKGSTKVWNSAPTITNDFGATPNPTAVTALSTPTVTSWNAGDVISFRAAGTLTLKNVIFWLNCYDYHVG